MIKSKDMGFDKISGTGKTEIWDVRSKSSGYVLGRIGWHPDWCQFCFCPYTNSVFNNSRMIDIIEAIKQLSK